MATIDPSIALGVKPIQIEDPVNRFARQQELSVNMMKGQELQRNLQEDEETRNFLRGANLSDPNVRAQLNTQFGKTGMGYGKILAEQEKAGLETKKLKGDIDKQTVEAHRQRTSDLAFNPSNENVLAHLQDSVLRQEITPEQAKQRWTQVGAMPTEQRKQYFLQMGVNAEKRLEQMSVSEFQKQDLGIKRERLSKDFDPVLQSNLAGAKEYGQVLAKSKATAEQALPGALQAAEEGIRLIDEMVGKQEIKDKNGKIIQAGTKPHPGFSSYVGFSFLPGQRFVEGSDAASYEIRQKQIEGKAFLQAFETLRGGGSITEKEGEKGTAAIMRMNKASSEAEYKAAARELQTILRTGMDRSRAKAGQTSPVVAPSVAPAANLGPNINTPGGNAAPAGGIKFLGFEEPTKK
jgi:hypothetical protein